MSLFKKFNVESEVRGLGSEEGAPAISAILAIPAATTAANSKNSENSSPPLPLKVADGITPLRRAQIRVNAAFIYWSIQPWLTEYDRDRLSQADQKLAAAMIRALPADAPIADIMAWEMETLAIFRAARLRPTPGGSK